MERQWLSNLSRAHFCLLASAAFNFLACLRIPETLCLNRQQFAGIISSANLSREAKRETTVPRVNFTCLTTRFIARNSKKLKFWARRLFCAKGGAASCISATAANWSSCCLAIFLPELLISAWQFHYFYYSAGSRAAACKPPPLFWLKTRGGDGKKFMRRREVTKLKVKMK